MGRGRRELTESQAQGELEALREAYAADLPQQIHARSVTHLLQASFDSGSSARLATIAKITRSARPSKRRPSCRQIRLFKVHRFGPHVQPRGRRRAQKAGWRRSAAARRYGGHAQGERALRLQRIPVPPDRHTVAGRRSPLRLHLGARRGR